MRDGSDFSFELVSSLALEEQRELLVGGDPPARLYAAWAIALRLGGNAWPVLRSPKLDEMPEGLRQQYVVIIAGLGERDILWAVAMHDASEAVRATAARYSLRTAPAPSESSAVEFAASLLESAPDAIRIAVVEECEAGRIFIEEARIGELTGGREGRGAATIADGSGLG